ncbi:MAG: thiol-disulfide isomerase [Vicinamibacterales bacterium]
MHTLFGAVLAGAGAFIITVALAAQGDSPGPSRAASPSGDPPASPTFTRDVAPILYKNCVTCHRPGEIAPMSLITYADVRPWARGIRQAVAEGVMPPWHADAPAGTFENERGLTDLDKDVIARWVAGGAPQGHPGDLPPAPRFPEGWRIGTPDAVFEMQEEYPVPASGTIEYEYFYIPTNFTEAKWLQAIEVRPGNRALVHHVLTFYEAPPEGPRMAPVLEFVPEHSKVPPRNPGSRAPRKPIGPSRIVATYAPGTDPQVFRPGTALRLAPGGVLKLQMHYTANGTAGTDRTQVGMIFAKEPPQHEVRAGQFLNAAFSIPPGAPSHQVDTEVGFLQDVTLWGIFPHTHVRGKRWDYKVAMPDGTVKPLLSVPTYDFNWQTYYMFTDPISLPAGARILASAWYDNSDRNPSNPDPKAEVKWGDQTWEEMQYTGILYTVKNPQPATSIQP